MSDPEIAAWQERYKKRMTAWKKWKKGELVFVSYKNRYYGEIISIEKTSYRPDDDEHRIVKVKRLYDEFGEPTNSRGTHSYDACYLTKVDEEYLDLQKKRFERVIDLYKDHNKGSG